MISTKPLRASHALRGHGKAQHKTTFVDTTELTVMYAMTDFEGKSPVEILDFLQQKNMGESMRYVAVQTLTCLAVTIPVSTVSVERIFSALNRIKTYAKITTRQF